MEGGGRWVRTAAKAVIVSDGRLLLNHCRDETGDWYALPGGGQEPEETLAQCIVRECREEIGAEVSVGRLLYVREIVVAHHTFTYLSEAPHQIEALFECAVPDDYEPQAGVVPDEKQVGVVWLDLHALRTVRVYPTWMARVLDPERAPDLPTYWGDVE